MAQSKHRDDQLFVAPVKFAAQVNFGGVVVREGRQFTVPAANAVAGATAGWLVTGANDALARLPAAETDSTLVIPIPGLFIGDVVTSVRVIGQVESAGANVTLDLSVRKATAAIADFTDAELGTADTGTLTADTLILGAVLEVDDLSETIDELVTLYALLTGTTAALTDIAISGLVVGVNHN